MLDPRVEDNAKKIKAIEEILLILAGNLDGVAWRIASEEERRVGIEISETIRKRLGKQ